MEASNGQIHHHNGEQRQREKLIIDTDPGIDDSVAIMMAFQSPGVQVLGLTTIFGNCTTEHATRNALILCEKAGHSEVPVAEGSHEPLKIHSDPEAADIVFTSGADIYVVGLNITTQVSFTDKDLLELRNSKGKHAEFLCDVCKFYLDWHIESYGAPVIFLHDPVSFAALVRPDLFTFKKGVVRVETQGICKGHTSMDMLMKKWNSENPWTGYSPISVAWTVDVPKMVAFVKELVTKE
ncbi:unnamed protein product [Urochloa humidicola]